MGTNVVWTAGIAHLARGGDVKLRQGKQGKDEEMPRGTGGRVAWTMVVKSSAFVIDGGEGEIWLAERIEGMDPEARL